MTIVRPEPSRFDPDFFGYALVQIEDQLIAGGQGAVGQTELPRTDLTNKYYLTFPTCRTEQKRIVAVLDQAFAALERARAHAEANLADAAVLLVETRERLLDVRQPGWNLQKLANMITIKHGFAFKSEFFTADGDHVLLTPGTSSSAAASGTEVRSRSSMTGRFRAASFWMKVTC